MLDVRHCDPAFGGRSNLLIRPTQQSAYNCSHLLSETANWSKKIGSVLITFNKKTMLNAWLSFF